MKKLLTIALLLCSTLLNAQTKSITEWQEIDTLIAQGHYTSAYERGEEMLRKEIYFECGQVPLLKTLLENKNLAAIESQPRSFTPNILFVTYSESSGRLICAQLLDNSGASPRPISEIAIIEK